jgi:hypothetical protein
MLVAMFTHSKKAKMALAEILILGDGRECVSAKCRVDTGAPLATRANRFDSQFSPCFQAQNTLPG